MHALTQKSSEMHLVDDFSTAALMCQTITIFRKGLLELMQKKKKKKKILIRKTLNQLYGIRHQCALAINSIFK